MSNWNFGIGGGGNGGDSGLLDLKALLSQALGSGLGGGGGGGGGGLSAAVGSPSSTMPTNNHHGGGRSGGLDTNSSANESFFDPFSSMSSFGFFNPKDPGSNMPLPTSNSSSSMNCMSNHMQVGGGGLSLGGGGPINGGTIGGHIGGGGGHGHSKSPTYHHSSSSNHQNHQTSISPVFGAPNSPIFFGGSSGGGNGGGGGGSGAGGGSGNNGLSSNQHNNHYSSSSSNYSNNKFPITTFSIDETLPGGSQQQQQSRQQNNDSSIFGSDDISSNGNHYNSTSHYSNNHHGRDRERERERDRERDRDNSYSNSHGNGNTHSSSNNREQAGDNSFNQGVRETGIIEKLLHSYGFIQCCERQARLFFHFSQFEGTIEHLKLGDPVEFEMTYDRRTGKPIASAVTKIGPEVVLSEERVTGTVTTELHHESNGELQGRISYENRGECFFLPYCQEDIEGNVSLCSGDTVSFQIATNQRSGNLTARYVRLENPAQPVRYKGIVSSIKDSFGFIERADVAKEIFFHFSETRVHEGIVVGDNVEFNIQTRNGKEVACSITKLPTGTVIFEDIGLDILKGQVLKPIDKTQPSPVTIGPTPRSETMQGRLRYRGPDRQELEVVYGEKDQKGSFTMRHGDWVEFSLAVDRRDKQQRATNITLLEESFVVSGERREEGVICNIKDGCGYITCAERDFKMYFRYNELLDFNRQPKVGDDVEFTIVPDPTSPVRQCGIRIKYLQPGTVRFEIALSKGVKGVVVREPSTPWVSQEALAGILPSLANLGLPPNVTERLIQGLSSSEALQQLTGPNSCGGDSPGEPGVIQYQVNDWQQETIIFHWKDCKNLRDIRAGTKVMFDINQVRRNRELIAANIQHQQPSEIAIESSDDRIQQLMQGSRVNCTGVPLSSPSMISEPEPIHSMVTANIVPDNCFNAPTSSCVSGVVVLHSDSETPIPNESSSDGLDSPVDDILDDVINGDKSSPEDSDPINNGQASKYHSYRSSSSSETSVNECSNKSPRIVMKGFICTLKEGFGFIETITQDEEIFFHSSSLVGEFSALELGQEVEYVESEKPPVYGRTAADIVKPLPKGSIGRAAVFPEILHGIVSRPLRGANPDQTEYTGYIDGNDGHGYPYGIISMLNKKETLQAGEVVEFQLDAQGKPVNIRADRKKLRATVEAVKGQYGFLSYELDDGKKLFFHMSEVKDHQHLNPGDEVEFVILQNPRNGKSSACSVVKLGESQRPERLLNRVTKLSLDETAKRVVLDRQPYGPDGTRGFSYRRFPRIPGQLNSSSGSSGSSSHSSV